MHNLLNIITNSVTDKSPAGIAAAVGRLISSGEVSGNDRLPTVRSVAQALGISPSTVTDAWRRLQHAGLVTTDGRRGTFVRSRRQPDDPGRFWQVPVDPDTYQWDLSTGTPDPKLLPSLETALASLRNELPVSSYLDWPTLPALNDLLVEQWPYPAQLITVVDGAMDGLDRIITSNINFGDRVIVTDPGFPPALDMLELAGAELLPVAMAKDGPDPEAFAAALELDPQAVLLQPRAHNPTGWNLSAQRADQLAELLEGRDLLIIEDDHSGEVAGSDLNSLGSRLSNQVVHIHSFSKAYGPDLRLGAVGGPAKIINALIHRRQLGPAWSSRLLQGVLLHLLTDPAVAQLVNTSSHTYAQRRSALVAALAEQGVSIPGESGFNLWLEVADESTALISLASHGIGAAPGSPFCVNKKSDHLRLTVSTVDGDYDQLAKLLAEAARASGGRRISA
ncbi:MAG TPA: aminotransferase class I/II-fold pyridoxal phosphate-dependent enzyme [Acidimicrobiia bacterium]|nr:aminotransferase class I/II-fold pyridoxal phosphate-dependent enzyme [Acidimicrobiia bacterium]HIL45730.1 aminotransferase class I/II-fold pyridoxal phosphate-dependent enzyme [Acidimicrobiia bacterium]